MVSWTDYMLGTSTALCFGDRGSGGKCSKGCQMFRESMTPRYMPTDIEELEERRTSLLLSLTGQFTVVLFRFLTGHWSSGVIGLVVFCVGNRARCSLQNTTLTSFVVLGFGTGLLDSVDLLHNILSYGTGFFVLPLEHNLLQDLWAISLALAPFCEVSGARLAWDSFLNPDLLLRPSRQSTVQLHPGYGPPPSPWAQMGQAVPWQQPGWSWQGPAQPALGSPWKQYGEWYGHGAPPGVAQGVAADQSTSWSSAAYRAIFGGSPPPARGDEGDDWDDGISSNSGSVFSARRQVQKWRKSGGGSSTGGDAHGRLGGALSSTELVNDILSDNDEEERHCSQCGDPVPAIEARASSGTRNFAESIYCQACWRSWAAD